MVLPILRVALAGLLTLAPVARVVTGLTDQGPAAGGPARAEDAVAMVPEPVGEAQEYWSRWRGPAARASWGAAPGHLVRTEKCFGDGGPRPRQLVADRLEGSHLPHHRL